MPMTTLNGTTEWEGCSPSMLAHGCAGAAENVTGAWRPVMRSRRRRIVSAYVHSPLPSELGIGTTSHTPMVPSQDAVAMRIDAE